MVLRHGSPQTQTLVVSLQLSVAALGLAAAGSCSADDWNRDLLFWVSSCILWLKPSGSSSDSQNHIWSYISSKATQLWHLRWRQSSRTIFEIEAEPVEGRVEVSSVQHAALHRLLDVLSLELELLQGCVQVLRAHKTFKLTTTSN